MQEYYSMAGRKRTPKKVQAVDAEFVNELAQELRPAPPVPLTPDEIWLESEAHKALLKARIESIEAMSTPEERYDAITALTDDIQQKMLLLIQERLRWLDSEHPDIRAEGLEVVIALQDQSNNIRRVNAQLYSALGLDEKRGFVGSKEVPRLALPSMTDEKWKEKYGTPQGSA